MYNALEFESIRREVILCRQLGATGVVVGFLDSNLDIDISKTKEIVALAEDMEVTFHRAFDICNNPLQNLEKVIDCGCTRILTSGCKATAHKGMDMLKKLTNQANGRIKIMAGSGINAANAIEIINTTGVDEIHASCKHVVGNWNETDVEQFLDPSNSIYSETDSDEVRRLSSLIAQI
jgi:copper homeostasis protein